MMKNIPKCLIIVLITLLVKTTNAQDVYIKNQRVEVKNSTLMIYFNISVNNSDIKSNEGNILTPVLQSTSNSLALPKVIINGRNRNISYNRAKIRPNDTPFMVMKKNRKGESVVEYKMGVPFEKWMQGADLILKSEICGCRDITEHISNHTIARNISSPRPSVIASTPNVALVVNQPKREEHSLVTTIYFENNSSVILPNFRSNEKSINMIDAAIKDKNVTITSIEIVGSASPDGSYKSNEQLSKQRALALESYLKDHFNTTIKEVKTDWVSENWYLLTKLVTQSNMEFKQQVIDIITNGDIFSGREIELMNLESKSPYNFIKTNLFPELQNASCTIHYYTLKY